MRAVSPYAAQVGRLPVRATELRIGGAPARCWTYGTAGRTVVALHGLRGDHHGLEPIVAHLPGRRVIVPDLPGFGACPPLPGVRHDLDTYAAWTRELVAAVGGTGTVLLGHSFGSVVAAAAVAGGLDVAALVLVNPIAAPALAGPRVAIARLATLYHRLAAALPERAGTALLRSRAVTRIASGAMVTTRDRALRRWIHDEHARRFNGFADRRVLLEAFAASAGGDVTDIAAAVGVPTLLVAGERDDIAPLAAQRTLAALIPDARLVVVPGTGHLAHYEAPAAVAAAVAAFVDGLDRPAP